MNAQPIFAVLIATLLFAAPPRVSAQIPGPTTPSLVPTPRPALSGGGNAGAQKPIGGPYASLITGAWALSEFNGLPFALYAGKDLDAAQKYPLVLALHGKSSNNENGKQAGGWMNNFVKPTRYQSNPCIVVAPLCYQPYGATGLGWADKPGEQTIALVRALMKSLPVDPKRIYIVGHSMGGFGVCHLMAREPMLFAAGVPVSGYGGAADEARLVRKPLWLFHATDDQTVPVAGARDFAKLFGRAKTFKYTEYPDGGHGIPGRVFDDEEVQKWLFSQGVHASSEPTSLLPVRPIN
jgi:predicted peptidase